MQVKSAFQTCSLSLQIMKQAANAEAGAEYCNQQEEGVLTV